MATSYDSQGEGWVFFAGIMLLLVGTLNFFQGLLLIAEDEIWVTGPDAQVVAVADVTTWGWVLFVVGLLEILAGFGVVVRNQLARWFGITVASLAVLAQFPVFFGPYPVWSFLMVTLSVLVIYGLGAYGGRYSAAPVRPSPTP